MSRPHYQLLVLSPRASEMTRSKIPPSALAFVDSAFHVAPDGTCTRIKQRDTSEKTEVCEPLQVKLRVLQEEIERLRNCLAWHETLSDLDHPDRAMPREGAEALAGPAPDSDNPMDHIVWCAKWRANLKLIRADAMIAAWKGGQS